MSSWRNVNFNLNENGVGILTIILTVTDRFSKTWNLIPLANWPTAMETGMVLFKEMFIMYGFLKDIGSDCGVQISSRVWQAFCKTLNINVRLSSGYHLQSNGKIEWLNQEIGRFLRAYCFNNQQDWSRQTIDKISWCIHPPASHCSNKFRVYRHYVPYSFMVLLCPWELFVTFFLCISGKFIFLCARLCRKNDIFCATFKNVKVSL